MNEQPFHRAAAMAYGKPHPYDSSKDGPSDDDSTEGQNKQADNKNEYDAQEQMNQGNTPGTKGSGMDAPKARGT